MSVFPDQSGLQDCPPVGGQQSPVGDKLTGVLLRGSAIRRAPLSLCAAPTPYSSSS